MARRFAFFSVALACSLDGAVTSLSTRTVDELEAENAMLRRQLEDARESIRSLQGDTDKKDFARHLMSTERAGVEDTAHHEEVSHHGDSAHNEETPNHGRSSAHHEESSHHEVSSNHRDSTHHEESSHDEESANHGDPLHHEESSHHVEEEHEEIAFNHLVMEVLPGFVLSIAVIGFFMFNIGLLFVTNWRDADIRNNIYNMISTTVSIFGAAMVNKVTFDTFAFQIIPCPIPRGFGFSHGHKTKEKPCGHAPASGECVVGFIFFFFYYIGLNLLVVRFRHHEFRVSMIATMGGHLAAFGAVAAFGHMQHLDSILFRVGDVLWCWIVFVFAFVFFILLRYLSYLYRSQYIPHAQAQNARVYFPLQQQAQTNMVCEVADCQRPRSEGFPTCCRGCSKTKGKKHSQDCQKRWENDLDKMQEAVHHKHEWSEHAAEAEDEATALCLGFLILQHWYLLQSGELLPVEGDLTNHSLETRNALNWCFIPILLAGLLIAAVARTILYRSYSLEQKPILQRATKSLQEYFSMTLAWCVFRSGDWFWRNLFKDMFGFHDEQKVAIHIIGRITNAFAISLAAAILVLVIDLIIDTLKGEWSQVKPRDFLVTFFMGRDINSQLQDLHTSAFGTSGTEAPSEESDALDSTAEDADYFLSVRKALERKLLDNMIDPFKSLFTVLGFLVGICWEKSFTEANTVLAESFFELMGHEDLPLVYKTHWGIGPILAFLFDHPVYAKLSLGFCTVAAVLAVWSKYIAPVANLDEHRHKYLMIQESATARAVNANLSKEHLYALCTALGASGLRKRCKTMVTINGIANQCGRFAFGSFDTCCTKCKPTPTLDKNKQPTHSWECGYKNHMSLAQKRMTARQQTDPEEEWICSPCGF